MTRYWVTIVRVYPGMNDYVDTYETYESAMIAAGQILIDFDDGDARRKSILWFAGYLLSSILVYNLNTKYEINIVE